MPPRKKVRIISNLTAQELGDVLGLSVTVVIKTLFKQGIMRTVHQIVELESARKVAVDLGYQLTDDDDPPDEHTASVPRQPIIPEGGKEVALPEPEPESEQES